MYVTILNVTILSNPCKTKANEARLVIFSVEGTYHRGNILVYVTILYATILKNPFKTNNNKARMLFFLWKVSTIE